MNTFELKQVLAKIQLGDNRQVDELVIREWGDTIGMLDFEDSIGAVTMHRQESTVYLQGAHIVANVKRIQKDRAEREHHAELTRPRTGHPKPANYEAMSAAHADPVAFAREVFVYHEQLRAVGIDPESSTS